MTMLIIWKKLLQRSPIPTMACTAAPGAVTTERVTLTVAERETNMYEIKYLTWIWKRSFLGFWYKAPVVRTAHADNKAARRLGRLFTFDDMMGISTIK